MRFPILSMLILLVFQFNLHAEEKVKIGGGKPNYPGTTSPVQTGPSDVNKRLLDLELEVAALRRRVLDLEGAAKTTATPTSGSGWTTCMLETAFSGNFSATEPTKMSAMAKTLEACKAKAGDNSIFCDKDKVTCGN